MWTPQEILEYRAELENMTLAQVERELEAFDAALDTNIYQGIELMRRRNHLRTVQEGWNRAMRINA